MKKAILLLALAFSIFSFTLIESKTYHVTFTAEQWQSHLQMLDNAKAIMDKSTLPANVVSQWKDSITIFQQELVSQVQQQMKADTSKKVKP